MANVLERQIVLDGRRNCVVKFTGLLDTSDATEVPALRLTDLLNNDPRGVLWGLRVDEVQWTVSEGLLLALEWNSSNPQHIAQLSGHAEFCAKQSGGLIPDSTRAGFDGAINLRTLSYDPGSIASYTVLLRLIKLYS